MGKAPPPSPPQRWRITVVALCASLALSMAFSSGTATAITATEDDVLSLINQARGSNGLSALRLSSDLSRRAHRHSMRMADQGRLFHSCLECRRDAASQALAENVGVGDTIGKVHAALMASPGHRKNILSKSFRQVGVGVVRAGGRVWVTQLFG